MPTSQASGTARGTPVCYIAGVPADEFSQQDIEFHRATAASYDREVTDVFAVYHRHLLDPFLDRVAAEVGSPAHALDLGCGTGVVTLLLVERGFAVLGIDHSAEMLEIAERKLARSEGDGSYRLNRGDVRRVPAADGEFDCVTCQGLLHHLDDAEACIRELVRVLKPGGYFYVSEPCVNVTPLRRSLAWVWHALRAPAPRDSDEPESIEMPIDAEWLRSTLKGFGLSLEMRFLTHVPPLRSSVPAWVYLYVIRALSFPWKKTRGDLVFVFGRKPFAVSGERLPAQGR
jgi:ubiquinone/menaquinone biosynthesis C-methylase UbiE